MCDSPDENELSFHLYEGYLKGIFRCKKIIKLNNIKPQMFELSEVIRELVSSGTTSSFDLDRYFPELADHVFYQLTQER